MKIIKLKLENFLYFFYKLINPIFDPIKFVQGIYGYFWFIRDSIRYKIKDPKAKLLNLNLFPILNEKTKLTPFDAHYFYHPVWAFNRIIKNKPKEHVDVASDYRLSSYLSNFIKTTFIDIRPIKVKLKNLTIKEGSALNLPYKNSSVSSLSCLHVIEHIGLGRYGDLIDPKGTIKACNEFKRVLQKNGFLYIATPIGKEKICFNAHRVFFQQTIIDYFKPLRLIEFSIITDNGSFIENTDPNKFKNQNYACGLFVFKKL